MDIAQNKKDLQLIADYKSSRDIEVVGRVYQPYLHLVYGVCLKYFKDRDEAKDAVNQIFEILIVDLLRYPIDNFKSWLFVVCRNYCLMQLRQQQRISERMSAFISESVMESDTNFHPIDIDSKNDELEQQLTKCIEELKEQQRHCILLFYYDKKSYTEIAEQLVLDIKKVKSYIQNGKRNLRICIERSKVFYET